MLDDTGVPVNGQTRSVVHTETGWIVPVLSRSRGWQCGRPAVDRPRSTPVS
ncbi:MAG: hypothetical protein R2695_19990 [Acidimicrobiales bacterium]